jgi:hypothetical protein
MAEDRHLWHSWRNSSEHSNLHTSSVVLVTAINGRSPGLLQTPEVTHLSDSQWLTLPVRLRHISCIRVRMMSVQTRDFVDVAARSRELGCRVPVRLALLPGNFTTAANAGEFYFHAATPHVRSAWQSIGLEDEGPEARKPARPEHAEDTSPATQVTQVPLAVFFGAGLLAGSPWRVTVALGMVSSVLASHARSASPREVRLDVVVERPDDHGCACIEYQGDAFGIVALTREVRRIWAGT